MVTELLPEFIATAFVILALGAEALHVMRIRRLANLAFGPSGKPAVWARLAPGIRIASVAMLAWGLATLMTVPSKNSQLQAN